MQSSRSIGRAIILAGLIAGTIDVGAASLINWLSPVIILHSIASGLLGKASFTGGAGTAVLGLVLQWAMAMLIAGVYIGAARAMPMLTRLWVTGGLAYGVVIYVVMNFVVVPLSNAPFRHHTVQLTKAGEDMLAMLVFGLIVSAFARGTQDLR